LHALLKLVMGSWQRSLREQCFIDREECERVAQVGCAPQRGKLLLHHVERLAARERVLQLIGMLQREQPAHAQSRQRQCAAHAEPIVPA
jgi:hypothetical protein